MSKKEILKNFNPDDPGSTSSLFGLPFDHETSEVVIIPAPWEVTVSYRSGTAQGPAAILEASLQVDLHVPDIPDAWKLGASMQDIPEDLFKLNRSLRKQAIKIISSDEIPKAEKSGIIKKVNEGTDIFNAEIKQRSLRIIKDGKIPAILGGDHSSPFGLIQALAEKYDEFGILQIDAHADLRKAYQGFTHSHASIMYNVLGIEKIKKLIQVGVRDFSDEEDERIKNNERVICFPDIWIKKSLFEGITWQSVVKDIIRRLPQRVYISFDIDGLDPSHCPDTGTPVPGGLSYSASVYLLKEIAKSGRQIIGFDLCEVAPGRNEINAIVGARLLYLLVNYTGVSNGKLVFKD